MEEGRIELSARERKRQWSKSLSQRELKITKVGGAKFASTARFVCRRSTGHRVRRADASGFPNHVSTAVGRPQSAVRQITAGRRQRVRCR